LKLTAEVDAPVPSERLYPFVFDLARYPEWLGIVQRARPLADGVWIVDLRGRLGPFARSKRLRMVRTVAEAPSLVVFERAEDDGRQHSPWTLRAEVVPHPGGSHLTMHLSYGGALLGAVIERILRDEIDDARRRLIELVAAEPAGT
jgi:hypothetical protein